MTRPLRFLIQEELIREGVDIPPGLDHEILVVQLQDWRARLQALEAQAAQRAEAHGTRHLCMVSLNAARFIRRHCPVLRRGLFLDEAPLHAHRVLGELGPDLMLSPDPVFLPFGLIERQIPRLRALFGNRIFLRPDSPMKCFAGFTCGIDELSYELSARRQICNIRNDELVMLAAARDIAPQEYRFWITEGRVLSHAAYAHDPVESPLPPCPAAITALADRVALRVEDWCDTVVADLVLDEAGQPRLIELNGFSTSGLYPGVSLSDIAAGMDRVML